MRGAGSFYVCGHSVHPMHAKQAQVPAAAMLGVHPMHAKQPQVPAAAMLGTL